MRSVVILASLFLLASLSSLVAQSGALRPTKNWVCDATFPLKDGSTISRRAYRGISDDPTDKRAIYFVEHLGVFRANPEPIEDMPPTVLQVRDEGNQQYLVTLEYVVSDPSYLQDWRHHIWQTEHTQLRKSGERFESFVVVPLPMGGLVLDLVNKLRPEKVISTFQASPGDGARSITVAFELTLEELDLLKRSQAELCTRDRVPVRSSRVGITEQELVGILDVRSVVERTLKSQLEGREAPLFQWNVSDCVREVKQHLRSTVRSNHPNDIVKLTQEESLSIFALDKTLLLNDLLSLLEKEESAIAQHLQPLVQELDRIHKTASEESSQEESGLSGTASGKASVSPSAEEAQASLSKEYSLTAEEKQRIERKYGIEMAQNERTKFYKFHSIRTYRFVNGSERLTLDRRDLSIVNLGEEIAEFQRGLTDLSLRFDQVTFGFQSNVPPPAFLITSAVVVASGSRTDIERQEGSFTRDEISVYGNDNGKHATDVVPMPEGWTLVDFRHRFRKTLGKNEVHGFVVREGNGIRYSFSVKHGPWYDKWRHLGHVDIWWTMERAVTQDLQSPDNVLTNGVAVPVGATVPVGVVTNLGGIQQVKSYTVRLTFMSPYGVAKAVTLPLAPGGSADSNGLSVRMGAGGELTITGVDGEAR